MFTRLALATICRSRANICKAFSTSGQVPESTTPDVLIVGTGAAGLVAAVNAHERGFRPLIIEKSSKIGGTSAFSGGCIWVPNNSVSKQAGLVDSTEKALLYLNTVIKSVGPASSDERKLAYLQNGPKMVDFLKDLGFKWRAALSYPDYFSEKPGGSAQGRVLEGSVFNTRRLGDWRQHMLKNPTLPPLPVYSQEAPSVITFMATFANFVVLMRVLGGRLFGRMLFGQIPRTGGQSLVGQLLLMALDREVPIWRETSLVDLVIENGLVVGAVVERDGKRIDIEAKNGVILAAGGFAKNASMRERHGPKPSSTIWSMVPTYDEGDAIAAGARIGAATALLEEAWWMPVLKDPATGTNYNLIFERALPHSIIVGSDGKRFMNEAEPYNDAGRHQYAHDKNVIAIPSWLIVDSRHRKRFPLGPLPPRHTPQTHLDSGFISKAETLEELAANIGVDSIGLCQTVKRFNEMTLRGEDEDFGRGNSAYDRFFSDSTCKPNPNLGPIVEKPFYAVQVWPGDLGTKGGLVTDEFARVVREDGSPIRNLYASGNTTASVMGRTYPGAGSTLGPGMTFAWIATNHIADAKLSSKHSSG